MLFFEHDSFRVTDTHRGHYGAVFVLNSQLLLTKDYLPIDQSVYFLPGADLLSGTQQCALDYEIVLH